MKLFVFVNMVAIMMFLSSCGSTYATVKIVSANSAMVEAKTMGAKKYAPYEYYSAKLYLKKANEKNAYAEFQVAADYAEKSKKFSLKAYKKTAQKKHPTTKKPKNLVIEAPPPPPPPPEPEPEDKTPPGIGLPGGSMFGGSGNNTDDNSSGNEDEPAGIPELGGGSSR